MEVDVELILWSLYNWDKQKLPTGQGDIYLYITGCLVTVVGWDISAK